MKKSGINLPGFTLTKDGRLIRNKRALPVNKQIASKKTKRIVTRAQAIGIKTK